MGGSITDTLIPIPVCHFLAVSLNAIDLTNWQVTRLVAIPGSGGVPLRNLAQLFSSDAVVG